MFDLRAHVLGDQRSISAEQTDLGIIITTGEGDRRRFRSTNEALTFVHRYLGEFLKRAQRGGVPWGLSVSVAGLSATYGDMSYFGGGGGGGAALPDSEPIVRIRRRWHFSQGPLSALENALQIVRAYIGRSRGRRHAA